MNSLQTDQWVTDCLASSPSQYQGGKIKRVDGTISVSMPCAVGELCKIVRDVGPPDLGEVIGFHDDLVQVMPFGQCANLKRGDIVIGTGGPMRVPVGPGLLGRVVNAFGEPLDGKGPLIGVRYVPIRFDAPDALSRDNVDQLFFTGQRAIDGLLTLGRGQRVGLFAGSGVGKSTLLGQIAQSASADLNVIALIGERGREVIPFIEDSLGPKGMAKSVVIVATANETSLSKIRAAESATVISSSFREMGMNVMLMLDSVTRFAAAQRDIGLLLGEPPTSRGYTPSVFQRLALLLEQMGTSDKGSVTGIISVLVDGDDMNDPVADAARSILDGHIVLDRELANEGHFPAINVLKSASRVFRNVTDNTQQDYAKCARQILAIYSKLEDLIQIGAYQKGASPKSDLAIELQQTLQRILQQEIDKPSTMEETTQRFQKVAKRWQAMGFDQ